MMKLSNANGDNNTNIQEDLHPSFYPSLQPKESLIRFSLSLLQTLVSALSKIPFFFKITNSHDWIVNNNWTRRIATFSFSLTSSWASFAEKQVKLEFAILALWCLSLKLYWRPESSTKVVIGVSLSHSSNTRKECFKRIDKGRSSELPANLRFECGVGGIRRLSLEKSSEEEEEEEETVKSRPWSKSPISSFWTVRSERERNGQNSSRLYLTSAALQAGPY